MVRIVTGNLAGIETRSLSLDLSPEPSAEQHTQDRSQELMHLVHMASLLLRQGEVVLAQKTLDQACALAPLPAKRSEALQCGGTAPALALTDPCPSAATA